MTKTGFSFVRSMKWATAALILLIISATAHAQLSDTGSIVGAVSDRDGAAIAGARITVTETATNIARVLETNAGGEYEVPSLKVGTYSVTVEKSGFETFVRTGIIVDVQSRVEIDVKLPLGSVTQKVEVSGIPQLLDTQTAGLGDVVQSQQIVDLPLNGREYDTLVFLSPGITITATGFLRASGGDGYFEANGNNGEQNNYILDGSDNNSLIENFQGFSAQVGQPPVDALAEFNLQTRTYDTEFGREPGAVVNAQIKSGTNGLHGDLWEFMRNSALDANSWFLDRAGQPNPEYQRNQFGATLGGPIKKDKLFFFAAYEGTRVGQGDTQIGSVPTPLMRQLNFSELPTPPTSPTIPALAQFSTCINNAIVNPSCVDPVGLKIFNLYPLPNTNLSQDGVPGGYVGNNFIASPKLTESVEDGVFRADQRVNDKISLFEHYTIWNTFEHAPFIFQAVNPVADGSDNTSLFYLRNQTATIGYTQIINPTTILDLRMGYNRMHELGDQYPIGDNVDTQFGINGIPVIPGLSGGLPEFDVSGFAQLGSSRWTPLIEESHVWQYRGVLSKTKGTHSIKTGAEWRRDSQSYLDECCQRGFFGFDGQYTGQGITDLLLGIPDSAGLSTAPIINAYQNGLALFGQDTWRVTTKLTVNYGLRWELVTPQMSPQNQIVNFSPTLNGGQGGFFEPPSNASAVAERATIELYKRGFAPRLGAAYQITSKLVWRSGFGIFYQNYDRHGTSPDPLENPPILIANTPSWSPTQAPSYFLQQGFPANYLAPVSFNNPVALSSLELYGIDYNLRPGMIEQFSGGFEYSLARDLVLSASWVGNYGHRLWNGTNLNQKILTNPGQPSTDVPFPNYVITPGVPLADTLPTEIEWLESDGDSKYNALEVTLKGREKYGTSFLISYTNSKGLSDFVPSLDDGNRAQYGPQINTDRNGEWGLEGQDTPQRLVGSFTVDAPFGRGTTHLSSGFLGRVLESWQANGIATLQSGQPLSIAAPFDTSETGSLGARANCVPATTSFQQSVNEWFNTSMYAVPQLYTFGNCPVTPGPRTPGVANLDFSLFKNIPVTDRLRFQFRTEVFNIFNHPQFGTPARTVGVPGFGQITSLLEPPRQIQFALKMFF